MRKSNMKHISILVLNESVLASIVDPRTMFTGANEFLEASGRPPLFKVQFLGLSKAVEFNNGLFSVRTDALIKDIKKTDLVIIPAMGGDLKKALELNKD